MPDFKFIPLIMKLSHVLKCFGLIKEIFFLAADAYTTVRTVCQWIRMFNMNPCGIKLTNSKFKYDSYGIIV